MARPFEKLPVGAKNHLENMAVNGLLSESRASNSLGIPLDQFRTIIVEHSPSKKIWENALAVERDQLLDSLYNKAIDGDTKATQTLLAVRHGMTEKQPQGHSERVSVVFNLPPALDPKDYINSIKVNPALSDESN